MNFHVRGGGWWFDELNGQAHHQGFFDHWSGEEAVLAIASLSYECPDETFYLDVVGEMAEGIQGEVEICNGTVRDGRSEAESFGGKVIPPPFITYTVKKGTTLGQDYESNLTRFMEKEVQRNNAYKSAEQSKSQ